MEKQIFANEMTCNFNLREPKAKKPTNIYFVVCIEGKQIKFSTGVKIYPEQWNKKKQEAFISYRLSELDNQNNAIVNAKITSMKKDFMDYKDYLCENPNELAYKINLLKRFVYKGNMKKNLKVAAIPTLRKIINEREGTDSTKMQHTRNLNKFERFLKENKIEDNFQNINLKTISDYQQFLLKIGNTPQTIKNIVKGTLFPILKKADRNIDIPFNWKESNLDCFDLVRDKSNKDLSKNKRVSLTEEQVNSIYRYELTNERVQALFKNRITAQHIEKLQEIKDMFVFQCVVGQRISDVPKFFNGENTINEEHNTISIKQKKTGAIAYIPILPIAQEIMNKYKGKTLKYYLERNTSVNIELKRILKQIGGFNEEITYEENGKIKTEPLYELVHTHTARHTFVTIMCRKDIPKEMVILATGHENTKLIDEIYSHLSHEDKVRRVAVAFDKGLNPKAKEASTENINADKILELINKGIAESLKSLNKDIQEIKEVTDHIKANKKTIKEENIDMIINMVYSLLMDNVALSTINNMLDTTGLLGIQSASDVMTGNYHMIK